jgi:hypothetical protein
MTNNASELFYLNYRTEAIKSLLQNALKKIEKKENWIRGIYSEDENGCSVPATHPSACKFCSVGALLCVEGRTNLASAAMRKLDSAAQFYMKDSKWDIMSLNDQREHEDVVNVFHLAILKL